MNVTGLYHSYGALRCRSCLTLQKGPADGMIVNWRDFWASLVVQLERSSVNFFSLETWNISPLKIGYC
jgi:hypothetical protein